MYAQGDLLIIPVQEIPPKLKDCTPLKGPVVLAHGETTGHRHAFYDGGVKLYRPDDQGVSTELLERNAIPMETVEQWIDAAQPVSLKHEEHDTIQLPRGKYKVVRQREYDPIQERIVAD